jgi:predicted RNase H-like HicB family nuclease
MSEREVEQAGRFLCVVEKQLVKIAEPEEQQRIRRHGRAQPLVLLHHRSERVRHGFQLGIKGSVLRVCNSKNGAAYLRRLLSCDKVCPMKFPTVIDRDEDGMWVVECPAIPGCVSQGRTRAEALENIREAIALCLEVRAERGMPLTFEISQVEVAV